MKYQEKEMEVSKMVNRARILRQKIEEGTPVSIDQLYELYGIYMMLIELKASS